MLNNNHSNTRDKVISKINKIGVLPAAALEAQWLLADDEVDFDRLAKAIEYDPGLTSNILRIANCTLSYGSQPFYSVRDALLRLGTRRIANLAMGLSLLPFVRKDIKGYDMGPQDLLKHSIATALCAEELARELRIATPDYTFTAGLLHDIGKVALSTFVEIEAEPIMNYARDNYVPFDEAERKILGIDHAEVAAILLERWSLPREIVDICRLHHQPMKEEEPDVVLCLTHIADCLSLCSGIALGREELRYRLANDVFTILNLTDESADKALCKTIERINSMEGLLAGA